MIRPFDYLSSLPEIEERILDATRRVLRSGHLILGPETQAFETEFADLTGARHCVAVSSGTTALHLALWALAVGPGDEVVTVANTCAPTVAAIRLTGAIPVFADVCENDLTMDPKSLSQRMTDRTRCILPVHLWGTAARIEEVMAIADGHGVPVLEDCAQAHGTLYKDRQVGTFGAAGCFSFYPTKNIGTFGEGGAIVTDNDELADRLRRMRMYGYDGNAVSQIEGMNARINELQAAYLRVKLEIFDDWLNRRLAVAEAYHERLPADHLRPPISIPFCRPSYHQFVVRVVDRDGLRDGLAERDIGSGIHYPVPVHRMPAYAHYADGLELPVTERACDEIMSLPIHEAMTRGDAEKVAVAVAEIVGG